VVKKTLRECLLDGGIKGKTFMSYTFDYSDIYEVINLSSNSDKTNIIISGKILESGKKDFVGKPVTYFLLEHLDDIKLTSYRQNKRRK
jgi:hypothetical protein